MPDRLFGLPAHPLLVHAPVVLLPLSAVLVIVIALRPRTVRHYGVPLLLLSATAFAGAVLAVESGEGLEHLLNEPSQALERHAQMGERTRLIAAVFFVLVIALVAVSHRWSRAARLETGASPAPTAVRALAVAAVIVGVVMVGAVVYTGHTGAKLAWEDAGTGKG